MAYRRIPSYVYKARQGYVLQRAVPTDIRAVIDRAVLHNAPERRGEQIDWGAVVLSDGTARLSPALFPPPPQQPSLSDGLRR